MRRILKFEVRLVSACNETSEQGRVFEERSEEIMSKQMLFRLTFAKRAAVVTAGVVALAVTATVGIVDTFVVQAQSPGAGARSAVAPRFEVAAIKPCKVEANEGGSAKTGGGGRIRWDPGRLDEECQTVFNLIRDAFRVPGRSTLARRRAG